MEKIEIPITKTARYFMLGKPSDEIEEIWVVCHGYAQLANYFLKKFKCLENSKRLIIAPEGFHRFYWNGFSGRVVASWMTREDRLSDIEDYVSFLDNVVLDIKQQLQKEVKLNVLGFSQGAATACRWLSVGDSEIDQLILWGSVLPDDIDYFEEQDKFNSVNLKVVIGDNDEYYSPEKIEINLDKIKEKDINFEYVKYSGKHDLYDKVLLKVTS